MAADIPIVEPTEHQAGTTLKFDRSLPDFPSSAWTLSYSLRSDVAAPIDITASAQNSGHRVNESHTTTADWTAGDYLMTGYVTATDNSERHEVYCAEITIKPYTAGEETQDWKSFNRRMVDLIEDMLADRIPRDVVSYSVNGRSFTAKSNTELLDAYNYFKARLAHEERQGKTRRILIRRVAPR